MFFFFFFFLIYIQNFTCSFLFKSRSVAANFILRRKKEKYHTHRYVGLCTSLDNNIDTAVLVAFRNVARGFLCEILFGAQNFSSRASSCESLLLSGKIGEISVDSSQTDFYRFTLVKFRREVTHFRKEISKIIREISTNSARVVTDILLSVVAKTIRFYDRGCETEIWNAEERTTPWLLLYFQVVITTGLREIQYYSVATRSQWLVYSMTKCRGKTETNCRKFTIGSFPSREKTQRNPIRRWWIVKTSPSFL